MYAKTKEKIHGLLHPEIVGDKHWDKVINVFIIVLIILNVVAVMIETLPSLQEDSQAKEFFDYFDLISVIIFTIEYLLRVWSSNHEKKYSHPVKGRIKYMLSGGALIDLLAILPYYLHAFLGFDLRILRIMRLMRFLRLFRLTAYMKSAQLIVNIFKARVNELLLSLVLVIFLIIFSSCAIYFAEHNDPQNKHLFSSIPATIWWSVVTLTTTGYGDMYPVTVIGKALAVVIMLTGVAFFALPAGIITAGFLEEFRKNKKRKHVKCPHCGGEVDVDHEH